MAEPRALQPYKMVTFTTPEECPACLKGQPANSYQAQKEGYQTPIPMGSRRTKEREDGVGWSGLCADPATGFYIGGVGNDCRRYHKGSERCLVHTPIPRVKPEPEPVIEPKRKARSARRTKEKSE